jgi:hypothetical protein
MNNTVATSMKRMLHLCESAEFWFVPYVGMLFFVLIACTRFGAVTACCLLPVLNLPLWNVVFDYMFLNNTFSGFPRQINPNMLHL